MNYQPFLDMHILISDEFLFQFQQQMLSIVLLLIATLVAFYFLSVGIHNLVRPLIVSNANNKDLT